MSRRSRNVQVFIGICLFAMAAGWLVSALTGDRRSSERHDAASTFEGGAVSSSDATDEPAEPVRRPAVIPVRAGAAESPSGGDEVRQDEAERETVAESVPSGSEGATPTPSASSPEAAAPPSRIDPPAPVPPVESSTPEAGDPSVDEERRRSERQREYIRAAFNNLQAGVRDCYLEILDEVPDASDRLVVVVEFVAEESDQAIAQGQLMAIESGDWEVDDLSCFADVFEGISIPLVEGTAAGEQTVVRYPFQFSAAP